MVNRWNLESPYFLIDKNELEQNVQELKSALNSHWENSIVGYSFKTNSLPWLLKYFLKNDFYEEVVSDNEYKLRLETGYTSNNIIYNSPAKSKETFLDAIRKRCIVNIDSLRELYWLEDLEQIDDTKFEVGIRVNFDIE